MLHLPFKKISFYLALFLIPFFLIFVVESTFRIFNLGTDLSLFKKSSQFEGYYEINPEVGNRYFSKFEPSIPTNDVFLIEKPDTAYRVFVLGCSTAAGFPYQNGMMFSRILNYRLQDVFPNKRIEVVNLALTAVNSFAVADMMDEVLEQKPDAILIYTGHNEFYGCLGPGSVDNRGNFIWIKKIHLKLLNLRVYQFLQDLIYKIINVSSNKQEIRATLMQAIAGEKSIPYHSELYWKGIKQFEINISEVLKKAKNNHVPVFISEIVSNIKDQKPFISQDSTRNSAAIEMYERGQEFLQKKDFKKAKECFYKAKDLDLVRFRASEDINIAIHSLAQEFGATVVPMQKIFEQHSVQGLIGNNLMLEHLHPNIDGYFLMADAFFNCMHDSKMISTNWNVNLIKQNDFYRKNWGFTALDSLDAELAVKRLKSGWPFVSKTENTFDNTYIPINYIDSLAFYYKNYEFERKHLYLAQYYQMKGQKDLAYKEYLSLIKTHPYVFQLYLQASDLLIAQNRLQEAMILLQSAPYKNNK